MRDGLSGLSLIEAKTDEEEAGVIALIMRETLETKGKTCAPGDARPSADAKGAGAANALGRGGR